MVVTGGASSECTYCWCCNSKSATLTAVPGAAREDDSGDTGRSITALPRPDKPAEDRPDRSVRVEGLPSQHNRTPESLRPAQLA